MTKTDLEIVAIESIRASAKLSAAQAALESVGHEFDSIESIMPGIGGETTPSEWLKMAVTGIENMKAILCIAIRRLVDLPDQDPDILPMPGSTKPA